MVTAAGIFHKFPHINAPLSGLTLVAVMFAWTLPLHAFQAAPKPPARLDVQDVSYLWPVPKSQADAAALIRADQALTDGVQRIWPKAIFEAVIKEARTVKVINSAGRENQISFKPFEVEFRDPSNWKVVAFRIDPSAPGTAPKLTEAFGAIPQIRLILQPVTIDSDKPKVHDVSAHLVFNFVERFLPPAAEGGFPRAVPDKSAFATVVNDLRSLKRTLEAAGVRTGGPLGVHPGLRSGGAEFQGQVKAFLQKHLAERRLTAIAFMGLEPSEPWIFFAMNFKDGALGRTPNRSLGGETAQMLTFRGGNHVMPKPTTTNIDGVRGVSTAPLFAAGAQDRLGQAVFNDLPRPRHEDIPDLVANPNLANFFNTDCISCHTESSRRKELGIRVQDDEFRFVLPEGISAVSEDVLPQQRWNVRNFGWFPTGNTAVETCTQRTANESAESADFINREYPPSPQ